MKTASLKTIVVWRVVGVVVIVILIGAVYLLGNQVQNVRRGLLVKQMSLEGSLKAAVYQASLQEQLVEHKAEIALIEQMMPIQDEIGSIIGSFEAEAKKSGVIVTVPTVQEEVVFDKNGDKAEQVGSTRVVRMQIYAQGEPVALIDFMHTIEHLPFLLGTVSFVFLSDSDKNFWYSFSVTTIGGLTASTIFVLTVVPVMYALFERGKMVASDLITNRSKYL